MNLRIIAFVLFILSLSTSSCNIEKRIERQQDVFDNIGKKWLQLHPCANDSTFIYIPGKTDSIPLVIPILVKDSVLIEYIIDSINESYRNDYATKDKDFKVEITRSYNLGYEMATVKWKDKISKIKIPTTKTDTIKIALQDKQIINLLKSDLAKATQQINDCKRQYEEKKGSARSWFLLFLIASIIALISIFFNFKK